MKIHQIKMARIAASKVENNAYLEKTSLLEYKLRIEIRSEGFVKRWMSHLKCVWRENLSKKTIANADILYPCFCKQSPSCFTDHF
jgi:hypothetical protein